MDDKLKEESEAVSEETSNVDYIYIQWRFKQEPRALLQSQTCS